MADERPIIDGADALLILEALLVLHERIVQPIPPEHSATDRKALAVAGLYERLQGAFAFEVTDEPASWLDKTLWHERDEMAHLVLDELRRVLADRMMTKRLMIQEAMRRFVIECKGRRLYHKPTPYPWGGSGTVSKEDD